MKNWGHYIGTTYGSGDGSTTFQIPDLRTYFIRGASSATSVGIVQNATQIPYNTWQDNRGCNDNIENAMSYFISDFDSLDFLSAGVRNLYSAGGSTFNGTLRAKVLRVRPKNTSLNYIIRVS